MISDIVNIIAILLIAGIALWVGFFMIPDSMRDGFEEYWTSTSLEKISCEQMAKRISEVRKTGVYRDEKFENMILDRWDEGECSNASSQYWRGDDWKYQKTIEDVISEVEN